MKRFFALALATLMVFFCCSCSAIENFLGRGEIKTEEKADTITLFAQNLTLEIGETKKISWTASEGVEVTLTSSDDTVAMVDQDGNVTAVSEGETDITVSAGAASAVCHISVQGEAMLELTVQPIEPIELGKTAEIICTVDSKKLTAEEIDFCSSDSEIATVDEQGFVTATGIGSAVITASLKEDLEVTGEIEIKTQFTGVPTVTFAGTVLSLEKDQTKALSYSIFPAGVEAEVCFSSSDEGVVSVDDEGNVTGVSNGMAEVSVLLNGAQADRVMVSVTGRDCLEPILQDVVPRYALTDGVMEIRSEEEKSEEKEAVTLMLGGDIMCLSSQQRAAKGNGTYNFNSSFDFISEITKASDFAIANLETLTSPSNPYAAEKTHIADMPNCNAPETILDAARYAGFDALVTANNHCCDGGSMGILETIGCLDAYQFPHTGTFAFEEDERFILADVKGIRVAILSYTEYFNGKNGKLTKEQQGYMLNEYSKERVEQDVLAAKEAGAEFIIAYNHWGTENTNSVTTRQRQHAQEMADAGVDLIAGSHPHVIQHAEYLEAKDGRKVFVIYSLGNFVSSMSRTTMNNDIILLQIKLARTETGVVIQDGGYFSFRVMPNYKGGKYVLVPVSEALNGNDASSALKSAQKRINAVMENEALHEITALEE